VVKLKAATQARQARHRVAGLEWNPKCLRIKD